MDDAMQRSARDPGPISHRLGGWLVVSASYCSAPRLTERAITSNNMLTLWSGAMTIVDRLRRLRSTRHAQRPPEVPTRAWFDQPDALAQIPRRAINQGDAATLDRGYVTATRIVEQVIPHELIEAMLADLDGLFVADEAIDGLSFDDLVFADGCRKATTHRELLQRPVADRLAARDRSAWEAARLLLLLGGSRRGAQLRRARTDRIDDSRRRQ